MQTSSEFFAAILELKARSRTLESTLLGYISYREEQHADGFILNHYKKYLESLNSLIRQIDGAEYRKSVQSHLLLEFERTEREILLLEKKVNPDHQG